MTSRMALRQLKILEKIDNIERDRMSRKIIKSKEWSCESQDNGRIISCESKRGNLLSAFNDGSIRFNKGNCEIPIKADGKIIKVKGEEMCGVELT